MITIFDPDDDYTGIEIQACTDRFAGTARVYAGLRELTDLANQMVGFPKDHTAQLTYEFGSRSPGVAGGYCQIRLRCLDRAGHIALHVELEDEDLYWPPSSTQMTIHVEAAETDRFIQALHALDRERWGAAALASL